jgi:hypothetical protein
MVAAGTSLLLTERMDSGIAVCLLVDEPRACLFRGMNSIAFKFFAFL